MTRLHHPFTPPGGWVAWWFARRYEVCGQVIVERRRAEAVAAAQSAGPVAEKPSAPTGAPARAQRRKRWHR